ncbi:hypothetical protein ACFXKD_27765 [Nocardiopsis aegyptia]|uniref:phage terminase small subunit n=1 Tax=Nocardiopsis aegyptia TaxID=220378 RepID=UPI0036728B52
MGERGPVPKRSSQRRRRNKAAESGPAEITQGPSGTPEPPPAPDPDEDWHPIALRWYQSLTESGQRYWYEPSDWATAYLLAESISRDLSEQIVTVTEQGDVIRDTVPLKGANLSAYLKAMSSLLVTEGDRRRARLELTRATYTDQDEDAAVVALDEWTARFSPPEETG